MRKIHQKVFHGIQTAKELVQRGEHGSQILPVKDKKPKKEENGALLQKVKPVQTDHGRQTEPEHASEQRKDIKLRAPEKEAIQEIKPEAIVKNHIKNVPAKDENDNVHPTHRSPGLTARGIFLGFLLIFRMTI